MRQRLLLRPRTLPWKTFQISALRSALVNKLADKPFQQLRCSHAIRKSHHLSHDHEDFHRFTRGRFVQDEAAAMASRYLSFNIDELMLAAAAAIGSQSCVAIEKCADGMYNKAFLLTMDDGQEVIAKLPNPNAGMPYYTTASEVATMKFMREILDIPVPKIHAWCRRAGETAIAAEYILMEKASGVPLKSLWPDMDLGTRFALVKSLVKYQAAWTGFQHQGYGSIYFAKDLPAGAAIQLEGADGFVLGPIVGREWCDDGRKAVTLDRGPWSTIDAYLKGLGTRELECIANVSKLPKPHLSICGPGLYQPTRPKKTRAAQMYLRLIESLTPSDPDLALPTAWHPDLHEENIFVDPEDPTVVTSLIDWQSTEVTPLMFQARRPYILDHEGPEAEGMEQPQLPDSIDELSPEEDKAATILYYSQALAVAYKRWIKARHPVIWKALEYQQTEDIILHVLGRTLLVDGEALFVARIVEQLRSGEKSFDTTLAELGISDEDIAEIEADSDAALRGMAVMNEVQAALGPLFPEKGCVRKEQYDEAKVALREAKQDVIDEFAATDADRAAWDKSWPFDD